jgi:MFS family permease
VSDRTTAVGADDGATPPGSAGREAASDPPDGATTPGSTDGVSSDGAADGAPSATAEDPPLRRNWTFVRFFLGQFVTNAGDSLYTVAILWLVFQLSGSTALTGVANAMLLLPYLLQVVAGPVVDRVRVRRLLVGTQVVQGVVVLVVPLAASLGHLSVPLLLALVPTLALMSLLVSPVPATLLPRIVPDGQLSRANSALSTVTLGLDMVFDALGGLFIAAFGATTLFLVDSLTFAVAAVLFAGMAVPAVRGGGENADDQGDDAAVRSVLRTYVEDLRAGVDVLRGTVFVDMLVASAVANFAVGVTLAVLPAYASVQAGAALYGLLLGALGAGRMVGSVAAARLSGVPYGKLTATTYLVAAALWVGSVYVPSAALTVALFGIAWIPGGAHGVLVSTLNQKVFPADLLGRVSSLKGTAATATLPVGSLVGGVVAEVLGPTMTMALAAGGFGFVGLAYALHAPLRSLPSMDAVDRAAVGLEPDTRPAAGGDDGEEDG